MNLAYVVVGTVLGAVSVFTHFKSSQARNELEYMRRMNATVKEVTHGVMAELSGAVTPMGAKLQSPKTGKDCVYYRYIVERREERRTDKGGVRYEWAKITDSKQAVPFYLDDGTGKIQLDLSNAGGLDIMKTFEGLEESQGGIQASLFGLKIPITPNVPYRFTEYALSIGDRIYAMGLVKADEKGNLHLVPPNDGRPFMVSYKSEEALKAEKTSRARNMQIASIVLAVACIGLLYFGFQ